VGIKEGGILKRTIFILTLFLNLCNAPLFAEDFEIRLPYKAGEKVTVVRNNQAVEIGTIVQLPVKTRYPSYTASAWGEPSAVCASAVNALHLLVSVEKGRGRTLSIVPQNTIAPAAKPGTSFVVSTKAGTGCFGAWSPKVGSKVVLRTDNGQEKELSAAEFIKQGETLVIKVTETDMPLFVEIENRPGGRVYSFDGMKQTQIGRVLRPFAGTGRFDGSKFQNTGEIRANHPGVIDYSTCPAGQMGGFQIVPWDHALTSKEMQYVWDLTQWLVIAPQDGCSPLCGTHPLFKQGLLPGTKTKAGEKLWDLWSTYGRKCPLLVRINGGAWQKVPEVSGKQPRAFENVTHLRIYYPHTEEPGKR